VESRREGVWKVMEASIYPMEQRAIRAAAAWGFDRVRVRGDLPIGGSPQRSEFRCVVECGDGRLVILENIREQDRDHKQAVIDRLDFLERQGLSGVHPHIRALDGRHIVKLDGLFWQASPYIGGVPLVRPGYEFDEWRGRAMADFLIRLPKAALNLPENLLTRPFSILGYIDRLMDQIRDREPGLAEDLAPVTEFLQRRLAPVHDRLPLAFCHGDYHPLNMIWSEASIPGVIDWEFSGTKPEIYDVATLIGCMGMETPDALDGPFVLALVQDLRAADVYSDASWEALLDMTVAIRFGWLSEWLRARDTEMIELEVVYMRLLISGVGPR
jgi:homoserine kinase type II